MPTIFNRLPVVTALHRDGELPAPARAAARDTITLGWEERLRTRGRRFSDSGVAFGTALPRGTMLRAGDCFLLDDPPLVVVVVEMPEPVFVIAPRDAREWGLFAYQIGNRHQPLMIADGALVCPDVPGMERLLKSCGIPYSRATMAFTPVSAPMEHRH